MAICGIIAGCSARLNEAEGGDIRWHILGNSVHMCSVRVHAAGARGTKRSVDAPLDCDLSLLCGSNRHKTELFREEIKDLLWALSSPCPVHCHTL